MEKVICSGIWFQDGRGYDHQPKNIASGYVVCGRRHHNCFMTVSILKKWDKSIKAIQGFVTSDDRFLTREESYVVALAAGQIKESEIKSMMSEDLY